MGRRVVNFLSPGGVTDLEGIRSAHGREWSAGLAAVAEVRMRYGPADLGRFTLTTRPVGSGRPEPLHQGVDDEIGRLPVAQIGHLPNHEVGQLRE